MVNQLTLFDADLCPDAWSSWRRHLIDVLGYPATQINLLPTPPLLRVYRDGGQRHCLAVIVNRGAEERATSTSLADIASQHHAEFVAVGTPRGYDLFQAGHYRLYPSPSSRLPSWVPGLRRGELVAKTHTLLPFRDEDQLRKSFASCHDVIYTDSAKDPAAAFDLLSLIIAAKVMDEQSDGLYYQFSEIAGETEPDAVSRLTTLLREARRWLAGQDLADTDIKEVPVLRYAVASAVFRQLQDYSLTLTGHSSMGTDLLGVAYEQLVGSTFRGELGSYFTPRNIADFMVRVLDARDGRILDPSCGSGGLLIAAQRYATAEGSSERPLELYGNDLNHRMVEAAKVNFLVHQLDAGHVLYGDGLDLPRMLHRWFGIHTNDSRMPYWSGMPGPFDFVLANPPFAGHEKDRGILAHFETARRQDGTLRSLNKTLPFLELIVASLRVGGRAGIVIPTSVLNAEDDTFVRFRAMLLAHVELLAIIGLPEKAFVHTDCGIHGALIFLERCAQPREEYDVFLGWIDQLGYDRLGKPTRTSDFPRTLQRYLHGDWVPNECVSIRELIAYQRWDPTWLRVARSLPRDPSEGFVRLGDLLEVRNARWSRQRIRDDGCYTYFEVVDADLRTGRVLRVHTASGFELAKKGRIRNQVRSGDILLPNHRDSLMAAGSANGRSVVVVDDALDGILTTDRFMVLRPKIDPTVLVTILNSRGVRRQLVAQSRGAASLDIREHALTSVLVPSSLLDASQMSAIKLRVSEIDSLRERLHGAIEDLSGMVEAEFGTDGPIRPHAAGALLGLPRRPRP